MMMSELEYVGFWPMNDFVAIYTSVLGFEIISKFDGFIKITKNLKVRCK